MVQSVTGHGRYCHLNWGFWFETKALEAHQISACVGLASVEAAFAQVDVPVTHTVLCTQGLRSPLRESMAHSCQNSSMAGGVSLVCPCIS